MDMNLPIKNGWETCTKSEIIQIQPNFNYSINHAMAEDEKARDVG